MRKAQDRMSATRPYSQKMLNVIGHLANAHVEYQHPFLIEHEEVKRVGFIIVSTDRGLCGGLNINAFKAALKAMQDWQQQGVDIDTVPDRRQGYGLFSSVFRATSSRRSATSATRCASTS